MDYDTCQNLSKHSSPNSFEYDDFYEIAAAILNSFKYGGNVQMPYNYSEFSTGIWKSLEPLDYLKVFVCVVVIIGGLLGNVSVILTVALNRSMRTTINFYVANLAVADAMICIMCMLPHAFSVVTVKVYILGKFMCKFHTFTEMVCLICSVLTLSAISCDRCYAIMFPIKARTAKHRTSLMVSIIWIVSIVVSIPLLFVKGLLVIQWLDFTENQCSEKWPIYFHMDEITSECESRQPERFIYYFVVLTTLYFLPVVIIITAYSSILWRVRMADIPGEQNEANINAHSRTRKKVNKMVFYVLVAFITCWTPVQVIVVYAAFIQSDSTTGPVPEWLVEIQWASHFLAYANSFINPIIYGGFNKTFREGFFNILRCGYRKGRFRIPGLSGLTFTTRFTSSRSGKSSKSQNGAKITSQKSNKEMELMQPIANGDISPTAGDACVAIAETRERDIV